MEKRILHRESGVNLLYPVSCVLRGSGKEYVAEVVNYHFKGACLRMEGVPSLDQELIASGDFKLDFYLGQNCLQSDIPYRVSWREDGGGPTFGVEFQTKISNHIERSERFVINPNIPIQVSAKDPTDPHRNIFFQTVDVSESGMLLKTSLSNKHLFPGMKLTASQLLIPMQKPIEIELGIENTRPGSDSTSFLLGVSIRDKKKDYSSAVRNYLAAAVPQLKDIDQYLHKLSGTNLYSKRIKDAVTYRIIQTPDLYEAVLKLRFAGYGRHAKIKPGTGWQDQGEGLDKEGVIIGGFMGSQLVGSMELRFGDGKLPLRVQKMLGSREIPGIDLRRVVELNKLVVHPKAQGTDLVLGLLQRAHTIVVNRGQLDVLGVATDKLKGLYEKIGAVPLGMRIPHPHLENETLNLMLVRREIYHDGMRLNPHAWSVVYQAVHEHFVAMGMASTRTLTIKDRSVAMATRLALKLKDRHQRKGRSKSEPSEEKKRQVTHERTIGNGFIDPKWTRQEIVASVMLPYVREAKEMVGSEAIDRLLDEIGVPERFITRQSNWLSIAFLDAFLDAFASLGDVAELSRRAGTRSMKRDMLGLNYYVMKHFLTPEMAYATFSKIMPKFNRTRTYEVTESGPGRVRLSLGLVSPQLLPRREESCQNWQASFEAYIQLMTGKPGRVKKISCCYHGSSVCSYEVLWERSHLKVTQFLPLIASAAVGLVGYQYVATFVTWSTAFAVSTACFLGALLLASIVKHRWLRSDYDTSYQEFLRYQQEAAEKYAELQQSKMTTDDLYREARVVEQTMRDIQKKDDVGSLLQTALDAVCSSFRFDRGFAMIVDEDRRVLRTAAVAGLDTYPDALWQFQVDVSTIKENPMLLSSVYNSGVSVVIDDIESHIFQLNESSRGLVQQFGSQGFVMVAIPAKQGSWGVIIADKKSKDRRLTRRDLVVLERLSQQIGVALDKKSDLQRERNLRIQFQRYAPSALLLASENSEQQAILGAQMRRVGVLFVDIRGFTKLSETLPPAKTVELINGLFSLLDPLVRKYGGVVDKFLGDGALVTWGSLGTSSPDSMDMVMCATEFLESLTRHNLGLKAQGLMPLHVGIGLHVGDALVGTVGSAQRLEYTAIGPTVNLGARLEQLCKVYDCDIVASDDLMQGLSVPPSTSWERVENISVRGMERRITIWAFHQNPDTKNLRSTINREVA